jgi:hypothetical protein
LRAARCGLCDTYAGISSCGNRHLPCSWTVYRISGLLKQAAPQRIWFMGIPKYNQSQILVQHLVDFGLSLGCSMTHFWPQLIKRLGNAMIIFDVRKDCLKGDLR